MKYPKKYDVRFYVQCWECWNPCTSCRLKTDAWKNRSELWPWRRKDCSSWALNSPCLLPPRAPQPPLPPLLYTPATLTQVRHSRRLCLLFAFTVLTRHSNIYTYALDNLSVSNPEPKNPRSSYSHIHAHLTHKPTVRRRLRLTHGTQLCTRLPIL